MNGLCASDSHNRLSQMGKKESLEDTAKVLGRFFDGIEYRGFEDRKSVV